MGRPNQDPRRRDCHRVARAEQEQRGRYEAAMWRDAGLEEPNAKGAKGAKGANADAEMEVDNLAAGGFFGWMGRDQLRAGRVRAGAYPPPAAQGP